MTREMKNSGIPWIGEIPEGWTIELIGNQVKEVDNPNTNGEEDNALQFKMGSIISKSQGNSKYNPETLEGYNIVDKGVIMLNGLNLSFDFISQRVGLVRERGVITSTYLAVKPTDNIDSEYLTYLFKAYDNCKAFHSMGKGLRQTLSYGELRKYLLIYPSLAEQQRIAEFLDRKCAEVDEMIALQEQIIEELKAYKQSVITEAVTKGLNPAAPMRDSGIEWIGSIPEHWEIKLLSTLFDEHKHKNSELQEANLLSLSYGKIVRKDINTSEGLLPQSFDGYNIISNGDIVFRLTDLQNDKKSLRTGLCLETGIITSAYVTIRARQKLCSAYFHYLVHSYDVCKVFYGMGDGVRQGMNYSDLRKLLLLSPPITEQQAIADYLDDKCADIDSLIQTKQSKIDSLKEYKKSIIYEYVTGKREVE